MMSKKVLGLDLGSNSIGWALLEEQNGLPNRIIDLGCRIFVKAVEEKTPTPKNVKRREARLARRVLQRRARRKQQMLDALIEHEWLPQILRDHPQPEILLNALGDPYQLRAKALDEKLEAHELGRVLLHLVQRRGFLSNRKTLLGDMLDDPDVAVVLDELEQDEDLSSERAKEETAFKQDIVELRRQIALAGCRTLGEYLAGFDRHQCRRNRAHDGGHLRTDRQMYREELDLIWRAQQNYHPQLTEAFKATIERILFYQRPLKLKADRIGRCSLEPKYPRIRIARLEYQRFRYLQDINHLEYWENQTDRWLKLNETQRTKLIELFEREVNVTLPKIRKTLGFDKTIEFNIEQGNKKLKGNITACEIRNILPDWDTFDAERQQALIEDLLTFQKKSALKKRLVQHWQFTPEIAVRLCLLEFEPGHGNLSSKAIKKLLPFLEQGQIFSDARVSAGYGYEPETLTTTDKLGPPPEIANPIVQKGLHELRRLINALIAEYGKPDAIRLEMARDLEMNTRRYADYLKQQKANTQANDEATEKFDEIRRLNPHLQLRRYPSRDDKLKYRLWKDQDQRCAYSGQTISLSILFGPEIEIDHIVPYSESLDDSYMNKVVCYAKENRNKGQRTPFDAFSGNEAQWNPIVQALKRWPKSLRAKTRRFFMTGAETQQRDFIANQLNDTRYLSRVALTYLKPLGADISVSKGQTTAWVRHQWGLNNLLGDSDEKDRSDHRHHAIDALVIACIDRRFYKNLVETAKQLERQRSQLTMRDLHVDPPWPNLRHELQQKLAAMIVSHAPQRKLSGELHEATGAGYIEGIGNVYRKVLDGNFKQIDKIIDPTVKALIDRHLQRFGGKPKQAFAEGITVYHQDGKTPIKRVRVLQSKTTLAKLQKTKFGAKNKQGHVFKWLSYGNLHHVEILRDKETGRFHGEFVTMMEASHRARGIGKAKQPIVNINHGERYEFMMALHINDIVSIKKAGQRVFYRIQILDAANKRLKLRLHTAATLKHDHETLPDRESTIDALMQAGLKKHPINAIGRMVS
ncbi:MAG: type II CRISPR RNA-guided endonuclease Cas9 [Methylomicrobium sp.]